MSISSREQPAPAAAVARARAEVAGLHDRLWAAAEDIDLIDVVDEIAALHGELAAIEAAVLAEIDTREVPRTRLQWASTTDWYAHTTGTTRAHAKQTIRHAHDLLGERTQTLTALREHRLSPTQAAVICHGVADLPGDRMLRRRAEVLLLDHATRLDAGDLAKAARRVLDTIDPDRTERRLEADLEREDRAAHAQRFFSLTDDGAGGVRLKGRGSLEDGAVLRAALLPLTTPEPATDHATDDATGQHRDPRDHGARLWDALVLTAQHALDTHLPPTSHATVPRVSITIPIADLLTGLDRTVRTALTDDGLDLHPAVVRRLACDAHLIPVVLGTSGCVLDVARTHRSVTEPIWRALISRDQHCTFPGCTRPPLMTHAHHITHWADGGDTTIDNLALLCGEHHRTIHHTPWQIRINPHDRRPEFLPPPRHRNPDHTWIRQRSRDHPRLE